MRAEFLRGALLDLLLNHFGTVANGEDFEGVADEILELIGDWFQINLYE